MQQTVTAKSKAFGVEDYLTLEATSEIRHEFDGQQMQAMVGATDIHNLIVFGLRVALSSKLRPHGCRVFSETMKLRMADKFRYPDILVTCSKTDTNPLYKTEPILLAEVLSDSSARDDHVSKLNEYQQIPSLRCYWIVHQTEMQVDVFSATDSWHNPRTYRAGEIIKLPGLEQQLALDDIYAEARHEFA